MKISSNHSTILLPICKGMNNIQYLFHYKIVPRPTKTSLKIQDGTRIFWIVLEGNYPTAELIQLLNFFFSCFFFEKKVVYILKLYK